jgi:hypothetical protein
MTTQPTSISATVDQIFAELTNNERPIESLSNAGVKRVYDHEPASVEKGGSLTVSFNGTDATDWLIALRLYVADTAPRDAQRLLWTAVEAVDDALGDSQIIGPSTWEPPVFDGDVHMIQSIQRVGRNDF